MKHKFVTCKILGGLGNQMFQYAFIRALSLRNCVDFRLDISGFSTYHLRPYELEIFNIKKKYLDHKLRHEKLYTNNKFLYPILYYGKFLIPYYHSDIRNKYNPHLLKKNKGYFSGLFQNYKYFDDFRDIILDDFTFIEPLNIKNKAVAKTMKSQNSVSIHIRRGDYLQGFGTCPLEYYKKSINYVNEHIKNPIFFIFSDDLQYCKEYLPLKGFDAIYVDWNKNNYDDMRLMSLCKHNIIANSTFSRWGGYLNRNPDKIIIQPKKWFFSKYDSSNLSPESYILL